MRRRTKIALFLMLGLLAGAAVLGIAGYRNATSNPVVRQLTVKMPGWPAGAPALKVALLSDIHIGSASMDAQRLKRIISQVNGLRPDLALFAGDFTFGHDPVAGSRYASQLREPLSRLRARLGGVAVLGNHDHWTDPVGVRTALAAAGITVLRNGAVRRGPVQIVGLDDFFTGRADPRRAFAFAGARAGPRLVLTHAPDVAEELGREAGLVLAGHTHCGQVVLPMIGPLVSRSPYSKLRRLYDPRYRCGVVRMPGRLVVVTAGLGTSGIPVRFGAPPDLWLISLGP